MHFTRGGSIGVVAIAIAVTMWIATAYRAEQNIQRDLAACRAQASTSLPMRESWHDYVGRWAQRFATYLTDERGWSAKRASEHADVEEDQMRNVQDPPTMDSSAICC